MPYIISQIKPIKYGFILQINQDEYLIDEFLYQKILPYNDKEIDIEVFSLIQVFAKTYNLLKPLYKKIYQHELSVHDVQQYFDKNDIVYDDYQLIIQSFQEEGYLNDNQFIEHYKKKYEKNQGKKAFKFFLNSHHIALSEIEKALENYLENDEYVKNFIQQQNKKNTHSAKQLKYKIKAALIQKGFSTEIIEMNLDLIDNDDFDNLKRDYEKLLARNEKKIYKIISKLVNKGYNIEEVKKLVKGGEDYE